MTQRVSHRGITLVAAADLDGNIGKGGKLPWGDPIPEDMKVFRAETMGKTVIMGYKTLLSMGKPLPGRRNIVLTRKAAYDPELRQYHGMDVEFARSRSAALRLAPTGSLCIIGGEQIFRVFEHDINRAVITIVQGRFPGCDTSLNFLTESYLNGWDGWAFHSREHILAEPYNLVIYKGDRADGHQMDLPLENPPWS